MRIWISPGDARSTGGVYGIPADAARRSSTRWQRLSREDQIVELSFGMTRHAWKSVQRARLEENTGEQYVGVVSSNGPLM